MKHRVAAVAVSMVAVGIAVTAPAAAKAATLAPISTFTAQTSVYFKGVGSQHHWFTSQDYTQRVILAPHVALGQNAVFDYGQTSHHRSTQQYYIVGNHGYTGNGSGPWPVPYQAQKEFLALPDVQRASSSHYLVIGDYAQVGRFLQWEFGLSKASFGGTDLKVFTVSFWDDSRGRPVKITMSATSSISLATAVEVFSNYNKPLTITAP